MLSCLFRSALPVLLIFPALASAQGRSDPKQLRNVETVAVMKPIIAFDTEEKSCRPEPDILRNEVELVLRSAGIRVMKAGETFRLCPHILFISMTGLYFKQIGLCAVSMGIHLERDERLSDEDKIYGNVQAFRHTGIFLRSCEPNSAAPSIQYQSNDYGTGERNPESKAVTTGGRAVSLPLFSADGGPMLCCAPCARFKDALKEATNTLDEALWRKTSPGTPADGTRIQIHGASTGRPPCMWQPRVESQW